MRRQDVPLMHEKRLLVIIFAVQMMLAIHHGVCDLIHMMPSEGGHLHNQEILNTAPATQQAVNIALLQVPAHPGWDASSNSK